MMHIHEIERRSYCCGDACQYAEGAKRAAFLLVRTSHEAADAVCPAWGCGMRTIST